MILQRREAQLDIELSAAHAVPSGETLAALSATAETLSGPAVANSWSRPQHDRTRVKRNWADVDTGIKALALAAPSSVVQMRRRSNVSLTLRDPMRDVASWDSRMQRCGAVPLACDAGGASI